MKVKMRQISLPGYVCIPYLHVLKKYNMGNRQGTQVEIFYLLIHNALRMFIMQVLALVNFIKTECL
jgi:hypothetical protein